MFRYGQRKESMSTMPIWLEKQFRHNVHKKRTGCLYKNAAEVIHSYSHLGQTHFTPVVWIAELKPLVPLNKWAEDEV